MLSLFLILPVLLAIGNYLEMQIIEMVSIVNMGTPMKGKACCLHKSFLY